MAAAAKSHHFLWNLPITSWGHCLSYSIVNYRISCLLLFLGIGVATLWFQNKYRLWSLLTDRFLPLDLILICLLLSQLYPHTVLLILTWLLRFFDQKQAILLASFVVLLHLRHEHLLLPQIRLQLKLSKLVLQWRVAFPWVRGDVVQQGLRRVPLRTERAKARNVFVVERTLPRFEIAVEWLHVRSREQIPVEAVFSPRTCSTGIDEFSSFLASWDRSGIWSVLDFFTVGL